MPVEIKELVIRAVVDPGHQQSSQPGEDETSAGLHRELIQACVKEVLRILKRSEER